MVSGKSIETQLKRIGFNYRGWGRTEVMELVNIILPDEEIYECVNGIYEGGFALLLATDVRVLLVDKKPLNYLTVEDLRFDMINEIDYNHRLVGAHIRISAGETNLKFTSINQPRLRRLIGHVQRCMAEAKKQQSTHQEGQNHHLESINQQLRSYLLAQYEQQQKLHDQLVKLQNDVDDTGQQTVPEPIKPGPELADYLFAQNLLARHNSSLPVAPLTKDEMTELYANGRQEVFGRSGPASSGLAGGVSAGSTVGSPITTGTADAATADTSEIHPFHIVYSKLPALLRARRFSPSALQRRIPRPAIRPSAQEAVQPDSG